MKKILLGLSVVAITASSSATNDIRTATADALKYMRSVYSTVYAPTDWKAKYDNWDLQQEYDKALSELFEKGEGVTTEEARQVVRKLIYSMRDYHVSVNFLATESASLPLMIRSAEGRYFIVHIDRTKLGSDIFPFSVGDEVVTFNGRPVADEVAMIRNYTELNVEETDQALAELALTLRRASRGLPVPQGPVTLGVIAKGKDAAEERQLAWDYSKEEIPPFKTAQPMEFSKKKPLLKTLNMMANEDFIVEDDENPHVMGAKRSYLPRLGETIWEAEDKEFFDAYIYRDEDNKMVGVVRIKSYYFTEGGDETYNKAVESFGRIINKMEKFSDGLVIDQLNNPGGSVFYLYALASMLSDKPMRAPRHTMSITPQDVMEAVQALKTFEKITDDESARKILGMDVIHGYPINYQFVVFAKSYYQTILDDWSEGRTMSRPYWIWGVDQLNPHPKATYTKPIMVLVNELDFSGGDFFPTILQDNKRATIFGVRTAGAGGYVLEYSFPNLLGINSFRVTQSLAHRVDENPIENLGVTPDVAYEMTVKDRQNNYEDYVKAVKAALKDLK